jgi:hypothetical protein
MSVRKLIPSITPMQRRSNVTRLEPPLEEGFVLPFGRFRGKSLGEVLYLEPSYITFLDNVGGIRVSPSLLTKANLLDEEEEHNYFITRYE